jgi:ATP-dependent RNA helicase DDX1
MIIKWSKNGIDFGTAYELPNAYKNNAFFPSVCMKNAEILFNFGKTNFKFPPEVRKKPYLFQNL